MNTSVFFAFLQHYMDLSVIILNYNAGYFLDYCLQSVQKAIEEVEGEVFVVDNLSTDGSFERNNAKYSQFSFIQNNANLGFAKGNNAAIPLTKGEYVLFLNPDTVIPEDCFYKVCKYMHQHPENGALGVRMVDGTGTFLPESKRMLPTPMVSLKKMLGLHHVFSDSRYWSGYYAGHVRPKRINEVDVLSGAFFMVKREAGEKAGWWDDRYFMYAEDIDFSLSIKKVGFKVIYYGATPIIHFKGESTSSNNKKAYDSFFYSMKQFYKKNFTSFTDKLIQPLIFSGIVLSKTIRSVKMSIKPANTVLSSMNTRYVLCGSTDENLVAANNFMGKKSSESMLFNENNYTTTYKHIVFSNEISFRQMLKVMINQKTDKIKAKYYFLSDDQQFMISSASKSKTGVAISK